MADRRPIKKAHERAIVAKFLGWYNDKRGTKYVVISEPDPPDAIIRSVRKTRWIEVADAFWTDAYAQDRYSYVTPGEEYKPMPRGRYVNMDATYAERFVRVLGEKLRKNSYEPFYRQYGPGILVLCMNHPWFDAQTITLMREYWRSHATGATLGYIGEVYMMFSSLNRPHFQKWRIGP